MTVLLVLVTILFFLGLDWAVRRSRERKGIAAPTVAVSPPPALPVRIPDGIFFARSHTWLNLFPSGKVRLGVDDFVGRLLENPTIVYLKKAGEHVNRGEPMLLLKENGHALTVRAPISGTILSDNPDLTEHPEKMREMLFSDGWAYTVKPDATTQLRTLLFGEESHHWIQGEFARLRDVLAGVKGAEGLAPALLQDGGVPVSGLIRTAPDEVWHRFEHEFLTEA